MFNKKQKTFNSNVHFLQKRKSLKKVEYFSINNY